MDDNPTISARAPHHAALGHFIDQFSRAEHAVSLFLADRAKLERPIAKALLSGVRIDAGISLIRRVYEARGLTIEPYIDSALRQLALINGVRNDLVHYGTRFDDDGAPVISTNRSAHIAKRERRTPVPSATLNAMMKDVHKISFILLLAMREPDDRPETNEYALKMLARDAQQGAWFYKPPQQASSRRKTRDAQPKQKRPPKPSRG